LIPSKTKPEGMLLSITLNQNKLQRLWYEEYLA